MANGMQRLMFAVMYRIGFTPWDGHPIPPRLREAAAAPMKGRALDIGCGTGDTSIFLARQGWDVTGVDFVGRALARARAKAAAAGVEARFVRADVTRLPDAGVGRGFRLLVDNGCLHGLSDDARAAYVTHVTAAAAPDATLIIAAVPAGQHRRPRGMDRDEIQRRFAPDWELLGGGLDQDTAEAWGRNVHIYGLRRHGDSGDTEIAEEGSEQRRSDAGETAEEGSEGRGEG